GEHLARADDDGRERLLDDLHGQRGLFSDAPVEIAQQHTAATERDPTIVDIRRQLRRNLVERLADGVEDRLQRLGDGVADLGVGDGDSYGDTATEVSSFDFHRQRFLERSGRSDLELDVLGGALPDEQLVTALHVLNDRLV